jgi:membrane protein implicated in regulation of membrane protease activity
MVLIWIAVALILIAVALILAVTEMATAALFAAFLVGGAVAAAVVAYAGQGPIPQVIVFAVVSMLGMLIGRPWVQRRRKRRRSLETLSGAQTMIGEIAEVVDVVGGLRRRAFRRQGHVRILGEDWPCVTADNAVLVRGTSVRITGIEKATLVVERSLPLGQVAPPPGTP